LEKNKSPQIASNFYRDQANRIIRVFNLYAPSFLEKNQETIKAIIIENYELIFPVLCCIDFIAISNVLIEYFTQSSEIQSSKIQSSKIQSSKNKHSNKHSSKKNTHTKHSSTPKESKIAKKDAEKYIAFCKKIKDLSQELLITGLSDIINHNTEKVDYPGFQMLKFFEEFNFINFEKNNKKNIEITDGYNYNNSVQYSGTEYAKFPPWGQLSEIEKHLGNYTLTEILGPNIEHFLQSIKKNVHISIIAEKAKLDDVQDEQPQHTWASSNE
jgi:hypothetical protein